MTVPSTPEDNKQTLQRWIDAVNAGKLELLPDIWAPDLQLHAGWKQYGMGQARSYEDMGPMFAPFVTAFPDAHVEILQLVAEGDRVTSLSHVAMTHTGPYFGLRPTGRRIEMDFLGMYRFRDGKIAEAWAYDDVLSLLDQLGAVPFEG